MTCAHVITDYTYATWWRCRGCGLWFELPLLLAVRPHPTIRQLPMRITEIRPRGHAASGRGVDHVVDTAEPVQIVEVAR